MKINQVAINSGGSNGGRMRKKYYQGTQIDLLKAKSNCVEENNLYGYVEVNVFGGVSIVSHIWLPVKNIIHSCNDIMIVFMIKWYQ